MSERSIERHHAAVCAASAEWLDDIVAFDESREWIADGATSMSAWLAGRFCMARGTAREWVRVAHAIQELPAIHRSFARGELCFDQLKPLTRFVTPDEDNLWARRAQGMSPAELWAQLRRRRRVEREEAQIDANLRYLWKCWDEDHRMLHFEGDLPAEQGVAFEAALERAAEDVAVEDDVRDPEGARLADALVGLVSSGADGSGQPVVVVHTDVSVLGTADGSAETELGAALAHDTVRRLACDAVVEWVVEAGGMPIGSAAGRGTFPCGSVGRSGTGIVGAGSPGAGGPDGRMRITSSIGAVADRPISTTWSRSATPTIGWSTRVGGRSVVIQRSDSGSTIDRDARPSLAPVRPRRLRSLVRIGIASRQCQAGWCPRGWLLASVLSVSCTASAAPRMYETGRRGLIGAWHRPH